MRAVLFALAFAGSCVPAPRMRAEDAAVLLADLAKGEPVVDVCSPDGASAFRDAVRVHARAMEQAGQSWPDFQGLEDGRGVAPEAVVVAMGFVAGHIQPGDIRGDAQWRMRRWALDGFPDLGRVRQNAHQVCPELFAVQLAGARHALARQRSGGAETDRVRHAERRLIETIEALRRKLEELGVSGAV